MSALGSDRVLERLPAALPAKPHVTTQLGLSFGFFITYLASWGQPTWTISRFSPSTQ